MLQIHPKTNHRGLTLIELVIALSVSTVILALSFSAFSRVQKKIAFGETKASLYRDLATVSNFIHNKIEAEIVQTLSITPNSMQLLATSGDTLSTYPTDSLWTIHNRAYKLVTAQGQISEMQFDYNFGELETNPLIVEMTIKIMHPSLREELKEQRRLYLPPLIQNSVGMF